ncbi:RNA splicing factor [Lithospermum erythrorhizon]|uniref:RNA splicing factor n=1 Tax=Lithospermum erythrorhizon TaxID=34254 RepID=A0AAV3RLJ0_LITER
MDPSDIRRVHERALSFVGKDYNCHVLWDKYLQFEFSQQQCGMLAHIYIRVLKFPTKGLHFYCDNFEKFVTVMEEEIKGEDDGTILEDPDGIPIIELMKFRALHKYRTIGNQLYQKALELDKEIKVYEAKIQTNYFQEQLIDADEGINIWTLSRSRRILFGL